MPVEARFYEKRGDGVVSCGLCPHACTLREGMRGRCGVRENRGGTLYSLVYGVPCSLNRDPIEKKPLFHFLPGTESLSLATVGCNFRCLFCQNHAVSQVGPAGPARGREVPPDRVVDIALRGGTPSVSYTYTEPTVYFEYAYDTGVEARRRGVKNVFVSNGYMSAAAREACLDFLDAINCDLKAFSAETYRRVIGGRLEPVCETIRFFRAHGVWVEVTTLVVTDMNDSEKELGRIAEFIASVDPSIPWHVSRFHPAYRMTDRPATPLDRLERAVRAGKEAGLKYVYAGNVPGSAHEHTRCPRCGEVLIERFLFSAAVKGMSGGRCRRCGERIEGVWT